MTKRRTKKAQPGALHEGGSETLTVQSLSGDISAFLSKKALRYLNVKSGDRLQVVARNGGIEITPILSPEQEIEQYLSH